MNLLQVIRRRLGLKILLANLLVVLVGTTTLLATTTFASPNALADHVTRMETLMGRNPLLVEEERKSFVNAINEVLSLAAAASSIAAVVVSVFVTGRIVSPIRSMTKASRNIAAGDYHQRVQMPEPDELGSLARSFNQMAKQLEQIEQKRIELIGDVAHELRTPLAGIQGTIEGLVDGVLPAGTDTFMGMQREVNRLQRLVQDLEELSRAQAGQITLDKQPVELSTLIRSASERLISQFAGKHVILRMELSPSLPRIRADAGRLTQVMVNLLGNALQYTPENGQVTVRTWHEDKFVHVAVVDTGIGIGPEHMPHVFERFYRADKSRARIGGGSGIGLTITKHLVEAHDGHIRVASAGAGQGSQVTLSFPIL